MEKEKFQIQKTEQEIKEEIKEILKLSPFFKELTQEEFEKEVDRIYENYYKKEGEEKLST